VDESLLQELSKNSEYRLLKRVPTQFFSINSQDPKVFIATIVDLETMGMDPKTHNLRKDRISQTWNVLHTL
jgi:DNA polymerase-3 subunit epsilon